MSLDTLVPDNPNKPYDMKELIDKVVDERRLLRNAAGLRRQHRHRLRRMDGSTVGIVANQPMVLAGCLDIDSSRASRPARFVRFCDASTFRS
jgi:propionyl-CoA carboxylase beta chain